MPTESSQLMLNDVMVYKYFVFIVLVAGELLLTDIDECDKMTSGCSQTCVNTAGSFKCGCNDGYFLDIDETTCIGKYMCFLSSGPPWCNS